MKRIVAMLVATLSLMGLAAERKVAVFVQNRTKAVGMQDEVPAIRERLTAALSEVEGFQVIDADSTITAGAFELSPKVLERVGCDYAVVASVVGASSVRRTIGEKSATVFTLRMTVKVLDRAGNSVDGMPMWSRQMPVQEAVDAPIAYYQMLIDQWAGEVVPVIATKAARWRPPAANAELVSFTVRTTVDKPIAAYESQTKGVKGELLAELRKVVGGASVVVDGVQVGTAPCELKLTPGLHQLQLSREWMKPYAATFNATPGGVLEIALEMDEAGIAKWGTLEKLQADVATRYAAAAKTRDISVKIDTSGWRDVGSGAILKVEQQ